MSKLIGTIQASIRPCAAYVSASLAGIEIASAEAFTLEPEQARAYRDLLDKAAREVEEMRRMVKP